MEAASCASPCSSAFLRIDLIRAWVYCINGPVFPLKSMDSLGLKSIVFFGSTFIMKYLSAPSPIVWKSLSFSSSGISASLPDSTDVSFASSYIFSMRSSASTTVPSRDFILPSGSSTIPYERWKILSAQAKPSFFSTSLSTWKW